MIFNYYYQAGGKTFHQCLIKVQQQNYVREGLIQNKKKCELSPPLKLREGSRQKKLKVWIFSTHPSPRFMT